MDLVLNVTRYSDQSFETPISAFGSRTIKVPSSDLLASVFELVGGFSYDPFSLVREGTANAVPTMDDWIISGWNLVGIAPDGALLYLSPEELSIADFLRAAELRFFQGDPSQLVVYEYHGGSGPPADGLNEIALWLLNQGGPAILGYGVAKGLDLIPKVRYRAIRKDWRERGLTAPRLTRLLRRQSQWDEAHLAKLLRLEIGETRCVLTQAGYARSADTQWRVGRSLELKRLAAITNQIVQNAEDEPK